MMPRLQHRHRYQLIEGEIGTHIDCIGDVCLKTREADDMSLLSGNGSVCTIAA